MTTTLDAPAEGATRHRIEYLLALAASESGPGDEQGRQAAGLLVVAFEGTFAERWADAMRAAEIRDALADGSMHWSQRYALDELRGYGDHQECAIDQAGCDLTWATDDLIALGGAR